MKAIRLTQEVKERNHKRFENKNVGDIFQFNIPDTFVTSEGRTVGYKNRLDLQLEDGIKDLEHPINFNSETQKLGAIVDDGDVFRYEAIDLTSEEIDARIDAQIPNEVPRVAFKLQLKEQFGLTDQQVIDAINYALQQELITDAQHYEAIVKWTQGTVIVRKDPAIMDLLPLVNQMYSLNITINDINEIFKMVY